MRIALAVLLSASVSFAADWDITPPPRGQWALDRTGKVSASTLATLNHLASALDLSGAGQLGVLVTDTTRGHNPRDFATGVFNSWGVGHSGSNDGILLFVAVTDRKSEIILGDGSKVSRSQTDVVMRDDLVANMKRGDLDGALLAAARSLDGLMRRTSGSAPAPNTSDNTGLGPDAYVTPAVERPSVDAALNAYAEGNKPFPEHSPRSWVIDLSDALTPSERARLDVAASDIYSDDKGRTFFLVMKSKANSPGIDELVARLVSQVSPLSRLPTAVIAFDLTGWRAKLYVPEPLIHNMWEYEQRAQAEKALNGLDSGDKVDRLVNAQKFAQAALLSKIPPRPMGEALQRGLDKHSTELMFGAGGFFLIGVIGLRRWNRKRVRTCEHCSSARQLLGEQAEDKHLGSSQLTEESIGSVDYDVWWCGRCKDVLVLRYGAFFSSYSSCPQCSAKTRSSNTTTLSHASEYSGGLQQVDERCANCSYTNSYTRTTARLSSSSSSDWSSSSSSSSSSSFGGGSSSGGGSSGSW